MIAHVSSNKDTFGNEKADILAKEGTRRTETDEILPVPSSYTKSTGRKVCLVELQTSHSHKLRTIQRI